MYFFFFPNLCKEFEKLNSFIKVISEKKKQFFTPNLTSFFYIFCSKPKIHVFFLSFFQFK